MKEFELIRIRHCDEPCCDLGQLQFNCPSCNEINVTCHGWYEIYDFVKETELMCEKCNHKFIVYYDNEENDWYLK